ncbi:MAG: cyclic nucleotide-binding domain-containing protein [Proteobacteria bacterium]|nr:cyclic nucleotide-binding domain-containing protein [Pseudomonadota bacterium]MBU0988770.1 cyclic nucleotide-binding domain-containing protein [Pseudomonadota bacterium]MBU1902246.1 cyclic nucleotide-binding domain-containing protein [Pseudomonadota bacterium]
MDVDVIRTALKDSELFSGLDHVQVELLIVKAGSRQFSGGETVYQKGEEAGGTVAFIVSGKINAVAENGYIVKELGAGEVIGEVGTIGKQGRRTVTLTTVEPTEILEWYIHDIEETSPELLKRLKDLAWKRIKYWIE